MFIRNAWYVAAWSSDVTDKPVPRMLLGEPIVLFRRRQGGVAALLDRCCHRGLPLSVGHVRDDLIVCGYHGLAYEGSGRCVEVPGQRVVSPQMRIRAYPVIEQDDLIWIWMGEPDRADGTQIPRYSFHCDRQNWPYRSRTQRLRCSYRLVIDNLLDLTHLAYVHKRTIGGDPDAHTKAEFSVAPTGHGVKFTRWLLNSVPPPTYVEAVGFTGRVDRWMEFEFVAPGVVYQFTGALPVGAGAYDRGERQGGFALRIFHGITPETDDSCLYFWSGSNGYRQSELGVTDFLFSALSATFEEDAVILEAQHASLKVRPEPLLSISQDRARVIAERKINEWLASEAQQSPAAGA
jgi:phenylpropionate dioxygenase-like ring-hydroxylating dioxygenase large terminal subunit